MHYKLLLCFYEQCKINVNTRLAPIMLKSLLFFLEFPKIFTYYSFFILVSSLLFQTYSHLASVTSHGLTALLEYLNILLGYINLLKAFISFSASTPIMMSTIYHS